MHDTDRSLLRLIVFSLLLVLGPVVAIGSLPGMLSQMLGTEYASPPPHEAYRLVFDQPVPQGVSNLQSAGRVYLSRGSLWLRFEATPELLDALTASGEQLSEGSYRNQPWRELPGMEEATKVSWSELEQLDDARWYRYRAPDRNRGWSVSFVVDREREVVFVEAMRQ